MIWIDDEVEYRPEISVVTHGEPVKARVVAVGINQDTLRLQLPDGEEASVEARLCKKIDKSAGADILP